MAEVVLELRIAEELGDAFTLVVAVENRSAQPLMLVTAPRYFKVEIEGAHGQYATGESTLTPSLPTAKDYERIAPHAKATLLSLTVERSATSPGSVKIGHLAFAGVPSRAKVRVTYKAADRIMPNLPDRERRTFFPGPADGVAELPF